jgi:hypothetical protein
MNVVTQLQEFRQAIYKNLCKAQDATFELMDALLLTRKAQSLADLSSRLRLSSPMVERLRSTTRYSSRSTTVNEALHRTNPSIRTNCTRRRSHELVEAVCQNPSRTHLRTFPIAIGRSSGDARDMATVH